MLSRHARTGGGSLTATSSHFNMISKLTPTFNPKIHTKFHRKYGKFCRHVTHAPGCAFHVRHAVTSVLGPHGLRGGQGPQPESMGLGFILPSDPEASPSLRPPRLLLPSDPGRRSQGIGPSYTWKRELQCCCCCEHGCNTALLVTANCAEATRS